MAGASYGQWFSLLGIAGIIGGLWWLENYFRKVADKVEERKKDKKGGRGRLTYEEKEERLREKIRLKKMKGIIEEEIDEELEEERLKRGKRRKRGR